MGQIVPYPGKALKAGSSAGGAVTLVQLRLTERGCGPIAPTGRFDAATTRAVKLFQARFPDALGQPLTVDGVVGPITWCAAFVYWCFSEAAKAAGSRNPVIGGSREGIGVFRRTGRKLASINKGFLDYRGA